ncbi:hypothetical protein PYW08_010735 [Mythimna loreyi]|uniref:Uncharacterized protein n=1 Tax=Mythimna loreyi TaxID=667449 RepID=A0ACC2Q3S6_9NEOP|nr:hypothetical protein PYW08_010735 [Mythimna loreyi]
MDEICRFCLKVSIKNMCSLQECDILYNMQRFLTINIPTEDAFPNKLCKECFKEISQIIKFCLKVRDNENKLQKYLKNGTLQDYYSKIIENYDMEIQNVLREPKIEIITIKNEDISDDIDFENDGILENDELSEATYCSSDDGITLSSIKKVKKFDDGTTLSSIKKDKKLSDGTIMSSMIKENKLNDGTILSSIKKVKKLNDESTLSSMKQEKKVIMDPVTVTASKTMPIVKPIKYLRNDTKRRQKPDPDTIEYLKPFTCLACLTACNSHTDLIDHYYEKHVFKSVPNKSYTEFKVEGKTTFSCNTCEKAFGLKKRIVRHVMTHSKDRLLSCKICARTYKTVPEIVRHARAHNGFRYQCPYNCGYTSAYQGAMKEHQSRHLDQYKYNCEVCGKGFNTKTWYDQHQNIHMGLRPFSCDVCGMGFPMARYLQHHKYSSHPQTSDLKRYSCIHCDEKYESAKSLSVHMLEHGIKKDTQILCDFCGKVLSSDYQLQYHHRMHAGIKPYSCIICKKKFAKKYNVRLHMSIHTGEKSHACGRCGKQYSQRSTLLRHLKSYHPSAELEDTDT